MLQVQGQKATAGKILDVASRLFAERGFANVSVRDICRGTGTTAPMIYYYFGNKKGLFDAVARRQIPLGDFISLLQKAADKKDPVRALDAFVASYLSAFPEHAFDPGLYMRDSATLDKDSAKRASTDLDKIRVMLSGIIRKGIDGGSLRKVDPDFAADCLLGMLNRVIFQHIHFSKSSDRESYRRFVTDFFLRAMAPKA